MASRRPDQIPFESRYLLNQSWTFRLADGFSHEVDRGRLLLSRSGLSLRLESFWHDHDGTLEERCASVLRQMPQAAVGRLEEDDEGLRRFGFRVHHGISDCAGFHGIIIGASGHVELIAQIQQEPELDIVLSTWRSLREASAAISTTRPRTDFCLLTEPTRKSGA